MVFSEPTFVNPGIILLLGDNASRNQLMALCRSGRDVLLNRLDKRSVETGS